MAEETTDFFAEFEPEISLDKKPDDTIQSVSQAQQLSPEERTGPDVIEHLKDDKFFDDFRPATEVDDNAALDQNQTLIDSLIKKGSERFFGEDVEDPFLVPRAVGIIAGSVGVPLLANQYLPATTPPPARAAVTFGASLFGTGIGAVNPELGLQIAEDMSLIPPGTRKQLGLNMADMQTVVEGELLLDSVFNTGFTVLRQTGRITGRFFTTGGVLTKEGREALGLAETAAEKFDIHMLPVQIRDRKISRGFVSIFGHFPFTTGKLKARAKDVDAQAQKALQSLGSRIAPLASFSELSKEVLLKSQRYFKAVGRKFNIAYTRLYERAAEQGVRVIPKNTTQKARQIIENIESANQAFAKGADKVKGEPGVITKKFVKFLRSTFIPMETQTMKAGEEIPLSILQESGQPFVKKLPDTPPNIALQDLKQLDALVDKIDEFMSTLDKTSSQDQFIRKMAAQLKLAIKSDLSQNVTGKNLGDAQAIAQDFKNLDEEFSLTMSQIFETATANRFGTVKKGGLGGRGVLREATRQPVDMLAKTIVLMDSPQAMNELRTLVGEKTFKRVTAHVIDNAVEKATKVVDGSGSALKQFSTDAFIKELGIGKGVSASRRGAISEMLKLADSPFTMDDLDKLVEIMRKIEDTPIPDVATFVARRAILGGWKSALGSFMVGAGTLSTVVGGVGSLFLASTVFLGGSKFFARMISKPETAKSFMKAMDETATTAVRRNAYVKAMRAVIKDLNTEEPENTDPRLMEHFIDMMQDLDDVLGFEGKSLSETLKEKAGEFIDLGEPQGSPEVDISKELSSGFGGDTTLK